MRNARSTGVPPQGSVESVLTSHRHSYVTLDGLRGVAAISVAIRHMPNVFGGYTVPNAPLAVDFFLQLSGFVIAYAYGERILRGMRFRDFLSRRLERLYPAYLLGFLLGLMVALAALRFGGSGMSVRWTPGGLACSVIPNALMLPQAFCGLGDTLFPGNLPMWSVTYELVINLLFFAGAVVLMAWRRSIAVAAVCLVGLVALTAPRTLDVGFEWGDLAAGFFRLAFSFLLGVAIHGLHLKPRGQSRWIPVALAGTLALILNWQTHSYAYELVMTVVVFPAIVVTGVLWNPPGTRARWLFAQLGLASYVLYVIHRPLYQLAYGAILRIAPQAVDALGAALGAVLVLAFTVLAWVLARYYELPVRRVLTRPRGRREVAGKR